MNVAIIMFVTAAAVATASVVVIVVIIIVIPVVIAVILFVFAFLLQDPSNREMAPSVPERWCCTTRAIEFGNIPLPPGLGYNDSCLN